MAENALEKGIGELKKLPPLAIAGIVVAGVGLAYLIKRSTAGGQSTEAPQEAPVTAAGPYPSTAIPGIYGVTGEPPDNQPRRDRPVEPTQPAAPITGPVVTPPVTSLPILSQPLAPSQPITVQPARPTAPTGGTTSPTAPAQPTAPTPAGPRGVSYPGLPDNYELNCGTTFKGLLGDWNYVLKSQLSKGINSSAFNARNLTAVALTGNTKWFVQGYDVMNDPFIRARWNQERVLNGLYPLTSGEMDQVRAQALSLSGPNLGLRSDPGAKQWNDVFLSYNYAHALFDRWNRPYQCGVASPRRESTR